jgi:hypothetical protein
MREEGEAAASACATPSNTNHEPVDDATWRSTKIATRRQQARPAHSFGQVRHAGCTLVVESLVAALTILRADRGAGAELERPSGVAETPALRPRAPPKREKVGVLAPFFSTGRFSSVRGFFATDLDGVDDAPPLCTRFFSSLFRAPLPEDWGPLRALPIDFFAPSRERRVRVAMGPSSPADGEDTTSAAVATVLWAILVSSASLPLKPANAIIFSVSLEADLQPPAADTFMAPGASVPCVGIARFSFSTFFSSAEAMSVFMDSSPVPA